MSLYISRLLVNKKEGDFHSVHASLDSSSDHEGDPVEADGNTSECVKAITAEDDNFLNPAVTDARIKKMDVLIAQLDLCSNDL